MEKSNLAETDSGFELKLRPKKLSEFIGHDDIVKRLRVIIQAAKERGEALGHILFHGPPGLGKTTLASILASEMNSTLTTASGPALEKTGDLAGILTNLEDKDLLFIDEIHRMSRSMEEYLYPAMEDFNLDLMIDSGPNARSVQVTLNHFSLVGATTRVGNLSSPLRSRFPIIIRLEYYDIAPLSEIVFRSAKILNCDISKEASLAIARRSRGTPRVANNLLRWVRDVAQLHNENLIDVATVDDACKMIKIDEQGLDEMDMKILDMIINEHDGGPVGLKTIAQTLGEEETTLAEVYEPYLIMQGFLKRGPRGREVTKMALEHLGRS